MNERRIARLQEQIKVRVAQVINNEMSDPRRGLITITRVRLDREIMTCKIYWSILGAEKDRVKNEHMLNHASRFIQREIARTLRTRTVPRVQFLFDEGIEKLLRIEGILQELREELKPCEELETDVPHDGDGEQDERREDLASDSAP